MRWTVNSDLIRLISLLKLGGGGGGGGVDSIKGGPHAPSLHYCFS